MLTGAPGELAAGALAALDGPADLGEVEVEDVVQQEGGALEGRQPLESASISAIGASSLSSSAGAAPISSTSGSGSQAPT